MGNSSHGLPFWVKFCVGGGVRYWKLVGSYCSVVRPHTSEWSCVLFLGLD